MAMPIYVYEELNALGEGAGQFEVMQRMTDAALTRHPVTGVPVRRVFLPPNIATLYTAGRQRRLLSPEHTAAKGFSTYQRDGAGGYVKTSGHEGPARLGGAG
jgi:hypothetical protein